MWEPQDSQPPEPRLRREAGLFLFALQFLTRLPVPPLAGWGPDRLARAARWFPAVGALVGVVAGAVYALAAQALPPLAAASLAVAAGMALTGALHEDGLSDTLDGLGGGATRERALEIMRDSRIGAYGAAGLGLSLLLRAAAIAALPPAAGLAALVAAHVAGRAGVVLAMDLAPYARPSGAGSGAAAGLPRGTLAVALALAAAICALAAGFAGVWALSLALLLGWAVLRRLVRRLGGWTGDGLGAVEQVGEIAALCLLSAALAP